MMIIRWYNRGMIRYDNKMMMMMMMMMMVMMVMMIMMMMTHNDKI